MPRSVNSVASRNRKRKVLKAARGYFGARSKVLTVAKNALDKAMGYAYVGRKLKKTCISPLMDCPYQRCRSSFGIDLFGLHPQIGASKCSVES